MNRRSTRSSPELRTESATRLGLCALSAACLAASCGMDQAPAGLRRTPEGPGATIRYDLGRRPLPDIPLPNDAATWPDPTSRTGLRLNASLLGETALDSRLRERFARMEGWGTSAPISVSFDIDRTGPAARAPRGAALDLANIAARHQNDDHDFSDDAIYLVNLTTGVPVALDVGAGNFDATLPRPDTTWANDARRTERSLLWETFDESQGGAITKETFSAKLDTDLDGVLDIPNLEDPHVCPGADPVCDEPRSAGYGSPECTEKRRARGRCIADYLLTWYERETDTLLVRPLLPLDEMTRYAVVITDRTVDTRGNPVRSPFDYVYPASMQPQTARLLEILNDGALKSYYGDLHGTGLDHVAFTWSFTTQPTVDDMKRLRDGLYGAGPFARWRREFPPVLSVRRAVGLTRGLEQGAAEPPGWETSGRGVEAGCPEKVDGLHVLRYEDLRSRMKELLVQGFGVTDDPALAQLLRSFEGIDHLLVGTFHAPFLLEGGPDSAAPDTAFHLDFQTGAGEVARGTVQFWLVVPKETSARRQPFDVALYSHGHGRSFVDVMSYAGVMARHGLATAGINAVEHGFAPGDALAERAAADALAERCIAPLHDAIVGGRARDLDGDGLVDPGGELLSSYLFHTRDGIRQSVLDQLQLTRILRALGGGAPGEAAQVLCRNARTGWDAPATSPCDFDGDGEAELAGDFDANGVPDVGGAAARITAFGESLGGILAAIQGAVDPNVSAAVPMGGGGGLAEAALQTRQEGVAAASLLRALGPLLVSLPAGERPRCTEGSTDRDRCTLCADGEASLRWVAPDVGGAGEVEIRCVSRADIEGTTLFVEDRSSGALRCARVDDALRFRVALPADLGDRVTLSFYPGVDAVESYASCKPTLPIGALPRLAVDSWGRGRFAAGAPLGAGGGVCAGPTCSRFRGRVFREGEPLTAPAEGLGLSRQTPAFRRFAALAQAALDPADPVSFAPFYALAPMADPRGRTMPRRAVLALGAVGDPGMPPSANAAFARAAGALPFLRPSQAALYPAYADFVTPEALFEALGRSTPNQELIDAHVIEGVAALAHHPAGAACAASANARPAGATFEAEGGAPAACYPEGCTEESEAAPETRRCYPGTRCDLAEGRCVPQALGAARCEEALFDVEDLDEGAALFGEQNAATPHRLARVAQPVAPGAVADIWRPRLAGEPRGADLAWTPDPARPLVALLHAYLAPEGARASSRGAPCSSFDGGTYLANLTARFLMTNGTDLYYLSHPATHRCLAEAAGCGYLEP